MLSARATRSVRIGRLGVLLLQPGFYVYVGSALGPGGARARLAHHMKPSNRPHWHIDYLKPHAKLEEVWYCHDQFRCEHEWARNVGIAQGASVPLAGFGASDCRCESHLYFFESRPSMNGFVLSLPACGRKPSSGAATQDQTVVTGRGRVVKCGLWRAKAMRHERNIGTGGEGLFDHPLLAQGLAGAKLQPRLDFGARRGRR